MYFMLLTNLVLQGVYFKASWAHKKADMLSGGGGAKHSGRQWFEFYYQFSASIFVSFPMQ